MDIGQTNLSINPIVYPVNTCHYNMNRIRTPGWSQVGGASNYY